MNLSRRKPDGKIPEPDPVSTGEEVPWLTEAELEELSAQLGGWDGPGDMGLR